jgi:hypothetical protein
MNQLFYTFISEFMSKQQTANSKQQTANSKQQTANSKQQTANSLKFFSFIIVMMTFFSSFGQTTGIDNFLSPGGKLETVFDRFGNQYSLSDIAIATQDHNITNRQVLTPPLCTSGMFELYFEAGSGMETVSDPAQNLINESRRNVVCQVFQDISNFINSPLKITGNLTKVKIWIRNIGNIGTTVSVQAVGVASGFYSVPSATPASYLGGIVDNEVYKTIHAGVDSYTNIVIPIGVDPSSGHLYHGYMALNFGPSVTWNIDPNATTFSGYDLYSVVLHEVTHALGFNSLINELGTSRSGIGNYFSRYDQLLVNSSLLPLLTQDSSTCSTMYNFHFNTLSSVSIDNLHPGCGIPFTHPAANPIQDHSVTGNTIFFKGTNSVPVYTPSCFEGGSSLSHFEDECPMINPVVAAHVNNQYYAMSNATSLGFHKRFWKPEERQALCDLGYSMNLTFASGQTNEYTYSSASPTCNGNSVAGINDGLSGGSFTFIGNSNTTITINGILNNDTNFDNTTGLNFECLEDVYFPTLSSLPVGNQTQITVVGAGPSSSINFRSLVPGLHLLRYVPVNGTGHRGNITYIYVVVRGDMHECATPDGCDLIVNGSFEVASGIPDDRSQFGLMCNWISAFPVQTPDYFNRNSPTSTVDIPCNFMGTQETILPISAIINDSYIGLGLNSQTDLFTGGIERFSETVLTRLKTPLVSTKSYQMTFDISLAEYMSNSSKRVQIYFSSNPGLQTSYDDLTFTPTAPFNPNMLFETDFIENTQGWVHITFSIPLGLANGENFIYIGGLHEHQSRVFVANTSNTFCSPFHPNLLPNRQISYYYIDNVSLVETYNANFNALPTTICANATLNNLGTYVQNAPTDGVFSCPDGGIVTVGTGASATYNFVPAGLTPGDHIISYTYVPSVGCPTITLTKTITVTGLTSNFPPIAPLCSTNTPPVLQTTAPNGVVGTWLPATIVASGTYVFTPTNSCNTGQTLQIVVNNPPNAGTNGSTTICSTSSVLITLASLITGEQAGGSWTRTSGTGGVFNATNGTFNPNASATTSTFSYTVTGTAPCITATSTVTVIINPQPNAGLPGSQTVCSTETDTVVLANLLTDESAGGTWTRATGTGGTFNALAGTFITIVATNSTFTYTVTGTPPCTAAFNTVAVFVNTAVTPTFTQIAPICLGAVAPLLPTTSNNGITGTWSPVSNNTATTVYTFTPTSGLCANSTTMTITVNPTPYISGSPTTCIGSTQTYTANETGNWSSSDINIATITAHTGVLTPLGAGTVVLTFVPNSGICASIATFAVTVFDPNIAPVFSFLPLTICAGTTAPLLPNISDNGIPGNWSPSTISNTTSQIYDFKPTNNCIPIHTFHVTVVNAGALEPLSDEFYVPFSSSSQLSPSVLTNDTFNGIPLTSPTLSIGLQTNLDPNPDGITINTDGTLNIPAGLAVGTYTIDYYPNVSCNNNVFLTPNVTIHIYDAIQAPERFSEEVCYSSESYNTTHDPYLFYHATMGGLPVDETMVTINVTSNPSPYMSYLPNGTIDVAEHCPSGVYNIYYTLCPIGLPVGVGCVDIILVYMITPTVQANTDYFYFNSNGQFLGSNNANHDRFILTNDLYHPNCGFTNGMGSQADTNTNVTLTSDASGLLGFFNINPYGQINSLSSNITPGSYHFSYTICDSDPAYTGSCDTESYGTIVCYSARTAPNSYSQKEIDFDAITITPNPSENVFNLSFTTNLLHKTTVEVYNMLSQKVFQDEIINVKDYQLLLGNLASGTYLLKINDGENSTVKKIIKK